MLAPADCLELGDEPGDQLADVRREHPAVLRVVLIADERATDLPVDLLDRAERIRRGEHLRAIIERRFER